MFLSSRRQTPLGIGTHPRGKRGGHCEKGIILLLRERERKMDAPSAVEGEGVKHERWSFVHILSHCRKTLTNLYIAVKIPLYCSKQEVHLAGSHVDKLLRVPLPFRISHSRAAVSFSPFGPEADGEHAWGTFINEVSSVWETPPKAKRTQFSTLWSEIGSC